MCCACLVKGQFEYEKGIEEVDFSPILFPFAIWTQE